VKTRRAVQPAPASAAAYAGQQYVAPDQPPPFFGTPGSALPPGGPASANLARWQDQRYGPHGRHAAPADEADTSATTRLPDAGEPTTQLRPVGDDDQPTAYFPRPPDDEDFGRPDPEPPRS
jgi:hypothetical protein